MPLASTTSPTSVGGGHARTLPRVERAAAGQVLVAAAAAVLEVALLVGATVLAFVAGGSGIGAFVALIATVLLVLDVVAFVETGAGLAWRAVGISLLAREDDAPVGLGRWWTLPAVQAVRSRGRRDPIALRSEPLVLPVAGRPGGWTRSADAVPTAGGGAPPRPGSSAAFLMVDGKVRHTLAATTIVGRRPAAAQPGQATVTLPDLSRTLSKSHLRIDVDARGAVIAMDLGSTNGSAITMADGVRRMLAPYERVQVGHHDTVTLGDHALTFIPGGGA
ncbi:FHA domain-containing protein [Demequina gelatinilytica]|uniref:FHA domain-containing protein n=1 Tax=Demequina gelatinilytica TaxID=1638980 RepID=UPI0007823C25|nr:FHA domain-containing protein [Demequina gelatinilytica]